MKLYYAPGVCSIGIHVLLEEIGKPYELEAVNLREGGQYRILTPDEYAAELKAEGDVVIAKLHPMVGGIPPELAWQHLHLFEEAFL